MGPDGRSRCRQRPAAARRPVDGPARRRAQAARHAARADADARRPPPQRRPPAAAARVGDRGHDVVRPVDRCRRWPGAVPPRQGHRAPDGREAVAVLPDAPPVAPGAACLPLHRPPAPTDIGRRLGPGQGPLEPARLAPHPAARERAPLAGLALPRLARRPARVRRSGLVLRRVGARDDERPLDRARRLRRRRRRHVEQVAAGGRPRLRARDRRRRRRGRRARRQLARARGQERVGGLGLGAPDDHPGRRRAGSSGRAGACRACPGARCGGGGRLVVQGPSCARRRQPSLAADIAADAGRDARRRGRRRRRVGL